MKPDNRNLILAIALSMVVLFGWQMFVIKPQLEKEAAQQELLAAQAQAEPVGNTPTSQAAIPSGKVSRNAPCPCGSGRKYKHCHGKI